MNIHSESTIPHPREAVFAAYRDHLPEAAAFLPDVTSITVLKRTEEGPRTILHNLWVSNTEIPAAARRFIKPEHLRWDDHATWHPDRHEVCWKLGTRVFSEAFHCEGTNRFHAQGPHATRVVVSGELHLNLGTLPGVPAFLAKRIAPQIEAFIVKMITPNLKHVNEAVGAYIHQANQT